MLGVSIGCDVSRLTSGLGVGESCRVSVTTTGNGGSLGIWKSVDWPNWLQVTKTARPRAGGNWGVVLAGQLAASFGGGVNWKWYTEWIISRLHWFGFLSMSSSGVHLLFQSFFLRLRS